MKIEQFLLLQILSNQQAYQTRQLELQCVIYAKLHNWTPEQQQKFASEELFQIELEAERLLQTLKIDFDSLFPDQSEIDDKTGEAKNLTLEEWQKRNFSKG